MKRSAAVIVLLLLVAGCAARHGVRPAPGVAPPVLELLESGDLELPAGCDPLTARVYRTSYRVGMDGRVTVSPPSPGSGCVERALAAWVATYRYAPVPQEVAAVVDWMAVTARRGG